MVSRSMARLTQPPPPENVRKKCRFIAADLTDNDAIGHIGAEISPRSRLDVLVLSSGTYERSREPAVFARQIAANLVGPYALLQQLLPLLIEAKGQVVFINSTQALRAAADLGQYAATKHAMKAVAIAFETKSMRTVCGSSPFSSDEPQASGSGRSLRGRGAHTRPSG
jgi:NAD(P)-dependent dehydrogenase (short-subunit alcohol dehydrogenase family)